MMSCLHKILSYFYGVTIAGAGITAVPSFPAGDPWWRVWIQQPEERPRSCWRGKWADHDASSWGLFRGFGFSSGPHSLTEKCRCEGPDQWKQFSCTPPPPPPPCSIFRLRCHSVDPVKLPFSFFLFFWIPAGRNELHLFGRLPGEGLDGGCGLGLTVQRLGKLAPESKDVQFNPIKIEIKSSCNNSFHYLPIGCRLF